MLDAERLEQLEDELRAELKEHGTEILTRLNSTGQLKVLLDLLGLGRLLEPETGFHAYPTGKIVVIGESHVKAEIMLGIAKSLGLGKDRFEFHLEYDDAKTLDFKKYRWSVAEYCVILVGPMPHSGVSKGEAGSIISNIEGKDGYPPIIHLGPPGELKITKTNFRKTMERLIQEQTIKVA